MFKAFAKFSCVDRNVEVRSAMARSAPHIHANDNLPTARRPCRAVLVGRWQRNAGTGRLEWHWLIEDNAGGMPAGAGQSTHLAEDPTRTNPGPTPRTAA